MGCCRSNIKNIVVPLPKLVPELRHEAPTKSDSHFSHLHSQTSFGSLMRFNTNTKIKVSKGRISETYEIQDILGEGSFGSVRLAIHKTLKVNRAVKSILKNFVTKHEASDMLQEVDILRQLNHPGILRIHESVEDKRYYHIVTDVCTGGELLDRIVSSKYMSEGKAANYIQQILSAVGYCHRHNILHRDLKPENILFSNDSPNSLLVIIDFGISRLKTHSTGSYKYGASFYTAPEAFEGPFTEKCDIWGCGIILYLMLCGYLPFNGKTETDVRNSIIKHELQFPPEEWESVSSSAKNLIKRMLEKDPDKRISIEDALSHSWIKEGVCKREMDKPICSSAFEKLSKFKTHLKLTHAVLEFIAAHFFTEKEVSDLSYAFIVLDKNGDGMLSKEELADGLSQLQLPHIDPQKIMEQCDANHDGYIDYSEFLTAATNWQESLDKEKMEAAFAAFDMDKDGLISIQELKHMLDTEEGLDEEMWREIMEEVDTNNDGAIDMEEFQRAIIRRTTVHN